VQASRPRNDLALATSVSIKKVFFMIIVLTVFSVENDQDVVEFEVSEHAPKFLNAGGSSRAFPSTYFPQVST